MPNTDERRAFDIVTNHGRLMYMPGFIEVWKSFLLEKDRTGKPRDIANEFLNRHPVYKRSDNDPSNQVQH